MRPFPRPSILRRLPLRPFSLRCPPSPTHIARRAQSGFQYRGGQQRPQYHRFGRAKQLQYLWYNSPTFRYGAGAVGVGALGFVGYNLERVPVSGTGTHARVNGALGGRGPEAIPTSSINQAG